MAITLTQLQSFLAVVRGGSVTAAAEELAVTQPSVSSAVAALSRELGVELTERVGRTVAPSAAGRAFAPYASDVLGLRLRLADGPVRPPLEAFMAFVERDDARLAVQGARLRTIGVPRPEAPDGRGGSKRAAAR